jgi:hypothetical protein
MRCTQAILAATLVMGVAACSQDSPTSMYGPSATVSSNNSHTTSSTADTSDFQLQASRQPIPVMVEGSAFGLDRTTLERTVTGNMQGANWGPMARFTPASQVQIQQNGHPYSVVMLLNPEQTAGQQVTGAQLCSESMRVGMAGPSSSTSDRSNTNATTENSPARGATNPAMRNNSASTVSHTGMGATSSNYDSSTGSSGSTSSTRSRAAAESAESVRANSSIASTSTARGSTNPAMRDDSAATEDRPAALDRQDSTQASSSTSSSRSRSTAATSGNGGNIHLVSALCHYDQSVNQVDTRAANVSGPNDPAFHNLIVTTTNELTKPSAQPVEHGEGQ